MGDDHTATRMTCHAPHPYFHIRGIDVRCSTFMGWHAGRLAFVTASEQAPDEWDGDEWVRCTNVRCRAWNRWRVVSERVA